MSEDTPGYIRKCSVSPYILTFRCLNCGRHEAFAHVLSDSVLSDEDAKMRLLEATCRACSWKGEVCGVSAVRIERAKTKATSR